MIEGLKTGHYSTGIPEFELSYWSDILYGRPLNPDEFDRDSPCFIEEKYVKAPEYFPVESFDSRKKIVSYLGRQMNRILLNDDLTLNYSFISDAIISRYFRDLEEYYSETLVESAEGKRRINELIRERLRDKLEEHRNDNIMLISHSMGSIIAFDVLTFLVPDIRIKTFVTMGSPLGLPVVMSKIAAENKLKGFADCKMHTPPGIIKNWYNFSDILDKVAFNYKLSDDFCENDYGIKPIDFVVINNYEIYGIRNPHKSYGYLRTPEFAYVLNSFLTSKESWSKQKLKWKFIKSMESLKSRINRLASLRS